jgi:hypothetical protein
MTSKVHAASCKSECARDRDSNGWCDCAVFHGYTLVIDVGENRTPTIKFFFSIDRFWSEIFQGDPSA